MGTETLEANLDHKLVGLCHASLFQVFLDVCNAYNLLCRGRCMDILIGYGLGTKLRRILQRFWDDQAVVTMVERFFGLTFRTDRGVTQGDLFYPTLLKVMVDAVVRAVMLEV